MGRKNQTHKLSYDLITKAVKGDPEALNAILLHYDSYIEKQSAYEIYDKDGGVHREIDQDIKAEIQYGLIEAIKKWHELI